MIATKSSAMSSRWDAEPDRSPTASVSSSLSLRELRLEVTERVDAAGHRHAFGRGRTPRRRRIAPSDGVQIRCRSLCTPTPIRCEARAANPAGDMAKRLCDGRTRTSIGVPRIRTRGDSCCQRGRYAPILHRYIDRLQSELSDKGFARDLLVMNGNGGMVSARLVDKESAKTVMSGPASGVMAAANAAKRAGIDNLITYDMGGTSTDVALVKDAIPAVSNELEIEYAMPIHVPMVDVRTIGSGGGSIASITDAGLLRVGPESAGATPGPICYGRGGENPTITDANLVLGRLNAEKLLSTSETPSIDKIRAILQDKIADPLGIDIDRAAGNHSCRQ